MDKENTFLSLVKTGLILTFFTPLILGPFGLTFSAYPKAVFFRTVIEITLIFYVFLVYFFPKYFPKKSPLVLAVVIFNVILILSALLGFNLKRSFLGTFDRGEGIILHFHLLLFFLMSISVFQDKKEWAKLLKLAFIIACFSSFAGILQKIGIFSFYGNSLPARISGTLANPDFFGAYMTLSIFLGIFILYLEKEKDLKFVWGLLIAMNLVTLLLSQTRAAWGGFIIGSLLFFFFLYSRYYSLDVKKRRIILALILIAALTFLFLISNYDKYNLDRVYAFKRFFSIFDIGGVASRLSVWEIASNAWKESPVLGNGSESFGFFYEKYFKAEYLPYTGEIYFDYPHNKYLGILSDVGIVGLFSYLSIFFTAFYLILKNNNPFSPKSKDSIMGYFLISFFVAFLIQNIFAFDTITIYFIVFLILGFVNNNLRKEDSLPKNTQIISPQNKYLNYAKIFLAVIISFLSLIAIFEINVKPTMASIYFVKALKLSWGQNDFEESMAGFQKSVSSKTLYDGDLKLETAKMLVFYYETGRVGKYKKETVDLLLGIKKSLEKKIEKPEIRYLTMHEILYKICKISYDYSKDSEAFACMNNILEKALKFNNQQPRLYRLMGEAKIMEGKDKEGEKFFEEGLKLSPNQQKDKIAFLKDLGRAYYFAQNKKKAADTFKKVIDINFPLKKNEPDYLKVVSQDNEEEVSFWENTALIYFSDLKDPESCYKIYKKAIEAFPQYNQALQAHLEQLKKEEEKITTGQ